MAPTLQQCPVCFNHYRSTPDGKLCQHGGKMKGQECSGFNNAKSQKHNPDRWINAVSSCIEQGNLSSAVRLVCSLKGLAESSPATFDKLCSIHPKIPVNRRVFPALTPTAGCVSPAEVLRAVKSFKNGSSGGLDGLRPQHLKDVFSGPLPIDDTLNPIH
ncbi:hypothetical protein HELRODRAFT_161176 [Helobdella robusta]|uniref:Reverse transcriptase domain-containing protein n=1 Tax=Helobdella robusta TaxID=6412 RepID=T1ER70_HELRO|nr:hypothetical protein HELRODRAFT_161176 [Helobdella robusta]ESO01966.1 hypothetical protein HELRODRAFT_161176 [Helobdella robusta]